MAGTDRRSDGEIIDIVIRIVLIGIFVVAVLQMLAPLVGLILWAVILAVAVHPLHAWLTGKFGGRGMVSAVLLTLLGLVITLGPVAALAAEVIDFANALVHAVQQGHLAMPAPEKLLKIPVVGARLFQAWQGMETNLHDLVVRFGPAVLSAGGAVFGRIAGVGLALVLLAGSVLVMGLLLQPGPKLVEGARRMANRIFAPRGAHLVDLAGATVRNVSRGVIGVGAIQGLLAGVLMAAFGVPFAGPLALVALFLSIIQVGPAPVILPVLVWGWLSLGTTGAVLFTVLMMPVMVIDNILKPILMSRGSITPALVILAGVIGGMFAYGLVGIFIGPIIMAVFYEILKDWLSAGDGTEHVVKVVPPVEADTETE